MIWVIPLLVIFGVAAGPVLACLRLLWVRRLAAWLVLAVTVAAADFFLSGSDRIVRMIGICCLLLGGMKSLVYAEWADENKQLALPRYGIFAFLWFGMDPAGFVSRRAKLSWKGDAKIGLLLMLGGTLGALLVWAMEWRQIFIMFLPLGLLFPPAFQTRVIARCLEIFDFGLL